MSYKIKLAIIEFLSQFKSFDPEKNFYIFSDPRGGSTWLAELISNIPSTAILWEPLHLTYSDAFQRLDFHGRQFIPENTNWKEAEQVFNKVFSGKSWNIFSSQMTNPLELILADKLIIKFCRGNRLIPWLIEHYHFRYKPVHMIRHPFSVVQSQLNQGAWNYEWNEYRLPASPFTEFEQGHLPFLKGIKTKEELLTAIWCISNKQTLEHQGNGRDWIFITYEDLFLKPKATLKLIFDEWGLEIPKGIDFTKQSRTSKGTFTEDKMKQLSKWKDYFNQHQIRKMLRVIDYFQIKQYSDAVLPEIC